MMRNDNILYHNEWLTLKLRDGWYTFSHEERSNGNLVAILVYRTEPKLQILGRWETCPPHDDGMALTTITGGVDIGKTPFEAMIEELWEEAGYKFDMKEHKDRLTSLKNSRPSKSADTTMWYYAFDATGLERREESIGDGTKGEEGAYCDWISVEDAVFAKDPHMAVMIARMREMGVL